MAWKIRLDYARAAYHVTARGNQGRNTCGDDLDRKLGLAALGEACEKTGGRTTQMPARTARLGVMARLAAGALLYFCLASPGLAAGFRQVLSLDGQWEIAEGGLAQIPERFDHRVPVPGLVDMAQPAFREVGTTNSSSLRQAFWYRRTFKLRGEVPAVARLKLSKAAYGAEVFLNGKLVGEHLPCFTPGWFDVRPMLLGHGAANDLIVRVGAYRTALPPNMPNGWDFEKKYYIPGLFDSVELILSGTPCFESVQVAPEITDSVARVQAELRNAGGPVSATCTFTVREAKSGKVVGRITADPVALAKDGSATVNVRVPIAGCRLWSPEHPFLYALEADSGADRFGTRFGMREFKFDPATGRAMLNGRPYFMRGSNITLYRFFEDDERGNLPWDNPWVRRLHQRIKDMHWNCLRYCIGFPPEAWYDIADEEGVLIEDEFPLWYLDRDLVRQTWPRDLTAKELSREYAEWMRERWNHPCVVIWDAQNETVTAETGQAIRQVRSLDLSGRPWDNGWSPAQARGDMFESHPYHYQNPNFKLADLATADPVPRGNALPDNGNAIVINEYGWLWLNRKGETTTATDQLYPNLLGANSTAAERFHLQATYLAADTEFWRAHRNAAAVMHFTTLGYSRSDGTSDNWTQGGVAKLKWEPQFYKYVRDAFAPVGMMIDYWKGRALGGSPERLSVTLINDLYKPWLGPVTLRVKRGRRALLQIRQNAGVAALGATNLVFDFAWPQDPGPCILETELRGADGERVHSVRDLKLVRRPVTGLEFQRPATASSTYAPQYGAANAVDGDFETYWSSEFQDAAWLAIDLGDTKRISHVTIRWERAYAKAFAIQVSTDGQTWRDVYQTDDGRGGVSDIKFPPVEARHIRLNCTRRGTQWGNAVYEMQVFP